MTADEWEASDDAAGLLDVLRGAASDRKLRLYLCAGCLAVEGLLRDPRSCQAVDPIASVAANALPSRRGVG
jgi:hypothetical protein